MKPQTPELRASQMIRAVTRVNVWRDSNNPLRSLTMPRAVQWLEDAQRGIMADLQWAYETGIEPGNADLVCIRERDEASIRDCEWIVKQIDPDTRAFDQVLADEQEAFLRELYEGIENLNDACAHMASYRFRGFAHLNPWEREDDPTYIRKLQPLDQWNLTREGYRGAWKWNPEARQVSFASLPAGNLLAPEEMVFMETRRPVNRIALVGHVRATTAEKDWDSYVEIYGIPGVFIILPEGTPNDKVGEYRELAENAAEQASGALPGGSEVVTTQEARSSQPFQPRLEWIQKQVVLAGTGGLLTMLAESGSGTLAGSVHADAFRQIARGVARRISQAFQQQLDKPRLAAKFPGRPILAYFELTAPEYRDTAKAVQNIVELASQGYRMPAEAVSELTGFEVEDTGAPVPAPWPLARMRGISSGGPTSVSAAFDLPATPDPTLTKIQSAFAALESLARDPATTDAALAAAVQKTATEFPELLPDLTAAIARPLAMDMAAAVAEGAEEGAATEQARSLHFDASQPRDENGRWSDTGDGGMSWTSPSGSHHQLNEDRLTITPKGRLPIDVDATKPLAPLNKAAYDRMKKAGKNPDDLLTLSESQNIHVPKSEQDRFAEANKRATAWRQSLDYQRRQMDTEVRNNFVAGDHPTHPRRMKMADAEKKLAAFDSANPEVTKREEERRQRKLKQLVKEQGPSNPWTN